MFGTARLARVFAVLTAVGVVAFTGALPASGHGDYAPGLAKRQSFLDAGAFAVPTVTSGNVHWLANFPETLAISGDFSLSTEHFYVSSLDTISVFDVSNPESPTLTGTTDNFTFENEAMNYGEQTVAKTGELRQFVLVGVDLHQASTGDISHVNPAGGKEIIVVDVTDPADPHIISRAPASSSTHTVACVIKSNCKYAYTAGSRGTYSIFDLRDWRNPKEVDSDPTTAGVQGFTSPALAPTAAFSRGAGHKWNFVGKSIAYHTGAAGTAAFDVSDPRHPRLLTTTNAQGKTGPWNNFIHHNSFQPNVSQFKAGAPASLENGNVLLITEEDYEQTDCSLAGSFQTWKIGKLSGANAITPLDRVELTDLGGPAEGVFPQGAFCSAHWFDYHRSGIVAAAYYNGGVRLLDVRDPKDIKPYGFAYGGTSQVWDSYWVPKRDAQGNALAQRTNILYSVDLARGLDVYRVDLPGATTTAVGPASATRTGSQQMAVGALALGLVAFVVIGAVRRRRVTTSV